MGLFDIFKSKTVEARYKTLLGLFKRTHRTFTITRNEKCVVEFTFGTKKESLQYWSIAQDFDAEKIGAYGYYWDPSKRVTISMHTNVDGNPAKVEKSFDQSINQTVIFNTIMELSIKEIAKVVDNLYGEEVEREIQEEKEIEYKQKGDNYAFITKENYELNALTTEQKFGLLHLMVSLCGKDCIQTKKKEVNTLLYLVMNKLKCAIATKYLNELMAKSSIEYTSKDIEIVKTIQKDKPLILFIYVCLELMKLENNNPIINNKFVTILQKVGFPPEDIEAISHDRYNYRFNNNTEEIEDSEPEEDKTKIIQTWSLLDFAREHGKMQLGTCHNIDSNKIFKVCVFTQNDERIIVSFSPKLGELTPQEIKERKNQLKVAKWVKGNKEGYTLYE